jgi:hypothetical protein
MRVLQVLIFLGFASQAFATGCAVFEGNVKIENDEDLRRVQSYCQIRGSLAIFTKGVEKLAFPQLQEATFINVDGARLEAVTFPRLEKVNYLYLGGSDLKVADFPALSAVRAKLYVSSPALEHLNLESLQRAWEVTFENNQALRFIFLGKIVDIYRLRLTGNSQLEKTVSDRLDAATRVLSAEEVAYLKNAEEEMRMMKQRALTQGFIRPIAAAPTGHAVAFGTIGFYYNSYRHYYPRYYSLSRYYWPWWGW